MEHLKILEERPYVWGSFVWNMFDFSSYQRREGDQQGRNDKGLVTFDRQTKKDAFFLFKANWSAEPVLHITSRRYVFRKKKTINVKVYSNLSDVLLSINGKEYPIQSPENGVIIWENITLNNGPNHLFVKANKSDTTFTDEVTWMYEHPFKGNNLIIKIFDWAKSAWYWIGGGVLLTFLIWLFGIRKNRQRPKWQRFLVWIAFAALFLITIGMVVLKIYLTNAIEH